jgi:hypothetical protein
MHLIRRRLVAAVFAVVLCHLTGLSSAAIRQAGAVESSASDETVCTCNHGAHAECPMHRSVRASAGTPSSTDCRMRCCGDDESGAVTLGWWTAPLVSHLELQPPASPSTFISSMAVRVLDAGCSPDLPPPRVQTCLS